LINGTWTNKKSPTEDRMIQRSQEVGGTSVKKERETKYTSGFKAAQAREERMKLERPARWEERLTTGDLGGEKGVSCNANKLKGPTNCRIMRSS